MTFGSLVGLVLTLAIVFALLAVTLRAMRRFAGTGGAGTGRLPLAVVQRLPLGPRQGIAIVRIGGKTVAVSVGEGGVRPLMELAPDDAALLAQEPAALPALVPAPLANGARDFAAALRQAVQKRGAALLLVAMLALPAALPAQGARQAPAPAPAAAAPALDPAATANAQVARADTMIERLAPRMDLRVGSGDGLRLSGTVGVVIMMGLLTLLPTLLLMMTSFTRILIVLHFLKQALGTQTAPPAHLVAGLALLLTGFVMAPTFSEVNSTALQPWLDGRMEQAEMLKTGAKPLRTFMLAQVRDRDLEAFVEMSNTPAPASVDEVPTVVLVSAFVTSELRTAFQIGFALFLPFIVIDIVVASVLMSMGMFMLPPAMISLPFKLLLFVLADGWSLVVQGLVASFR